MIGFSPTEVDEMSWWQFRAALSGWNNAHKSDDDEPPAMTNDEYDDMIDRYIH